MLTILVITASSQSVFGDNGIIADTDKPLYETGELLVFSGHVEQKKMPILALSIFDPSGTILSANNVDVGEDNTFSKTISLDSPFYDEAGTYTMKIEYGKLETEITFDIISEDFVDDSIFSDYEEPIVAEIVALLSEKPTYTDGNTIVISGIVSAVDEPSVLIGIYDPFGMPTGFYFGDINSDQEFLVSFLAKAGVNFKVDGTYYAKANYGESEDVVYFDFFESMNDKILETEIESTQNDTDEENTDAPPSNEESNEIVEESKPSETNEGIEENNPSETNEDVEKTIPKPNQNIFDETKLEQTQNDNPKPVEKNSDIPQVKPERPNDKEKESTKILQEEKPIKADNLSVEDIELGILLNQINLHCDQSEYTDLVSYYDGMGPALIRLCKYDQAISYIDQDIANEPQNVEILTNKGVTLAKLGYFEKALLHYDSALMINPSYVPALNNKGNALSQLGKFEEAKQVYSLAIKLEPQNKILQENIETIRNKVVKPQTNDDTPKTIQVIDEKNDENATVTTHSNQTPDILEQLGKVFSSIGKIFGF